MFEKVQGALEKDTNANAAYKNILTLKPGNTYIVRLLPNVADPEQTRFRYYQQGWNSRATGQYVSAISPQTFGERDPISEESFRIYRNGTQEEKDIVAECKLRRFEKWLANVYVVDDPTNPANNGQVKILRYGSQLGEKIDAAIDGEDADELGERVIDLSPDGCNLKIIVKQQGDFPNYSSSKFAMPSEIEGMDDAKMEEAYGSTHDLAATFTIKSYDELKELLDEHFHCVNTDAKEEETETPVLDAAEKSEPIKAPKKEKPAEEKKEAVVAGVDDEDIDGEIDDLLDGLDD